MAWTYSIAGGPGGQGLLTAPDGVIEGQCYSGHGEGLNNVALEADPDVGPIPTGTYTIGPAKNPIDHLGPIAMPLTPVAFDNPAITRSGFFMHGDFAGDTAESASLGCIVAGRAIRQAVDDSSDCDLTVIP